MKVKGTYRIVIVIMVAIGFVMAFGGISDAKTTLKLAWVTPPKTNTGLFDYKFKEIVEKTSQGDIIIELYPHGQLGSADELVNGVKMGTIEMVSTDYSTFAAFYEDLFVFQFPYLYRDVAHANEVTSPGSPLFERLNANFIKKAGIRMIGNILYGERHLTCNYPTYKPEDLKGKRIRVIPNPLWIAMMEGMGGVPTPVAFSELATALATGLVAGQENPLATIYSKKFHEQQKYLMLTGHMKAFVPLCINEKVWQGLSDGQKRILLGSAKEAKEFMMAKIAAGDRELLEKFKQAGVKIIGPEQGLDQAAFKNRVLAHCKKKFPQFAEYIKEIAGE
jgi:tripartite ATP-independent transporter DctP family solute receptor